MQEIPSGSASIPTSPGCTDVVATLVGPSVTVGLNGIFGETGVIAKEFPVRCFSSIFLCFVPMQREKERKRMLEKSTSV